MDILTTSLDALLHKATNTNIENVDIPALDAFCALINREKDGPHIASKLLAGKIHSSNEVEANHSLIVLDTAMKRCTLLHAEVGKFRFLNEMIKLVSPKYVGTQTPLTVKQKVLQLLYLWMLDYPKEPKIKDAYEMLKKQGLIHEIPLSVGSENVSVPERNMGSSIFNDEEKNRVLQQLLRSKNPDDLQAANRLIKNMVKEDDKRAELKSRRITELESVHNNARLLNEMLDTYRPGLSSQDELDLINELHQSCERLRPSVLKLISETQQNEELLKEVLQASDELSEVFDKYVNVIVKGNIREKGAVEEDTNHVSLLDLNVVEAKTEGKDFKSIVKQNSDLDLLSDVFNSDASSVPNNILKPIQTSKGSEENLSKSTKLAALDDLDALGEQMFKENLVSRRLGRQFNKVSEKIPMNLLLMQSVSKHETVNGPASFNKLQDLHENRAYDLDLNYLIDKEKNDANLPKNQIEDDLLVDITIEKLKVNENKVDETITSVVMNDILKLTDIFITLEEVKPSSILPLVILDEKNGLTVTLHFGKNKPRQDVNVVVITIISRSDMPLSTIFFQAVVAKKCKLKLQTPSGNELPAHNPFLPPTAITQIMLIANPEKVDVSLKFVVSYTKGDESFTEMGEVSQFPPLDF